jgi:DNA polymerase-3 subunit alpha
MASQRERFVQGARKNKIDGKLAAEIFDQMETFARYGFNKSHSAAYALISYQTAYLKAHYPVEFMAALLTSEMGDTEKVIKNLAECRDRSIVVLPPDINESLVNFTPVGDKIRFGLAAVKNVGEKAVEVVLESRGREGRFESVFDFCRRVDSGAINRRVIENLIKCGAFDSTGASRAQMMAVLDEAIKAGQAQQKGRESAQIDIFAALGSNGGDVNGGRESYPAVEEWSAQQMLAFEKESLGFYITGHPLDKHEEILKTAVTATIEGLREKPFHGEVRAGGVVTGLKLKNTKKGERYASFQLEDRTGFIEVIVWPDLYRRHAETLAADDPILVRGKLEASEERAQIIANEIGLLEQAATGAPRRAAGQGGRAERIHFYLNSRDVSPQDLSRLYETFMRHPGRSLVTLHLAGTDGRETVIDLPIHIRIDSTPELLESVGQLFGERITFELRAS